MTTSQHHVNIFSKSDLVDNSKKGLYPISCTDGTPFNSSPVIVYLPPIRIRRTMEDGESYLRRHHVLFYLEDAVAQLITSDVRRRPPTQPSSKDDENAGKRQSAGPKAKSAVDFLEEYFADV